MSQFKSTWYLSHRRPVKAQARLRRCAVTPEPSHTWSMEVDKGSDQKSDIQSLWMGAHTHLKNEFTKDEKCHNLMRWLKQCRPRSEGAVRLWSLKFCHSVCIFWMHLSRVMRKCVLCHMRTTKVQISLHSLISAFVVHCLDSVISLDSTAEISRL